MHLQAEVCAHLVGLVDRHGDLPTLVRHLWFLPFVRWRRRRHFVRRGRRWRWRRGRLLLIAITLPAPASTIGMSARFQKQTREYPRRQRAGAPSLVALLILFLVSFTVPILLLLLLLLLRVFAVATPAAKSGRSRSVTRWIIQYGARLLVHAPILSTTGADNCAMIGRCRHVRAPQSRSTQGATVPIIARARHGCHSDIPKKAHRRAKRSQMEKLTRRPSRSRNRPGGPLRSRVLTPGGGVN